MATKPTPKKAVAKKAVAKKTAVTSKKFPTAAQAKKTAAANPRPSNTPRVKGKVNVSKASKPFTSGKVAAAEKALGKVGKVAKVAGKVGKFARGASVVGLGLTAAEMLLDKNKKVSSKTSNASPKYTGKKDTYTPVAKKAAAPAKTAAQKAADKAETTRENYSPMSSTAAPAAKKAAASRSVTVKRGDTLWDIAQAHGTTLSALYKANPELAKRKAAGKTTIFSGTKVRIPKK